jgi:hypothetical protein
MNREPPKWWPPKVGSKLRHATWHGAGAGRVKHVDAVLHVVSVFEDKDGEQSIVTAEWFPTKRRWHYEVFWWYQAAIGTIWRDGTKKSGAEVTP